VWFFEQDDGQPVAKITNYLFGVIRAIVVDNDKAAVQSIPIRQS
jgi:hypothetical protein